MSIEVHNVTKRFGEFTALDNVSLEVEDGSLLALLGPSGSGKSTLLRIIAGLEVPDTGSISIHDKDATNQPVQDRGVGFVFQHYAPFKHMTVWDNIAFPLKIRKQKKSEIKAKVEQLLQLVHLDGFAKRFPSQLSGGQRQRMALARALAAEPEVLLLDEPFGALDARVREELRVWLRRLHEEMHVTTIFVTHDQEEAMEVAEKIVVMSNGTIEQVGTPREIYESPANDFVMQFVGPVTHVGGEPVRPHDFEILEHPADGAVEALVERVVYLGFEVRAELSLPDRKPFWVQLTRTEVEHLELREGEIIYVRSRKSAKIIPLKQSGTE